MYEVPKEVLQATINYIATQSVPKVTLVEVQQLLQALQKCAQLEDGSGAAQGSKKK